MTSADLVTERPTYLTKSEAAKYARVSSRTIERAIRNDELKAGGSRGAVRIKPEWIDEWLEQRNRHGRNTS